MRIFLYIAFLLILLPAKAQVTFSRDSILNVVSSQKSDTARVNRLLECAQATESIDFVLALDLAEMAIQLSKKNRLPERESYGINLIGNVYYFMGDYDLAMENYLRAMVIRDSINDFRGMGTSRINVGSLLADRGDWKKSREYFDEALDLFIRIKETKEEAAAYQNIGDWFYYQENFDSAMVYYRKSAAVAKEHDHPDELGEARNGIATLLKRNGEIDSAILYYRDNILLCEERNDLFGRTVALNNLSLAYSAKGDFRKAITIALESMELAEKIGNKRSMKYAAGNLTWYYRQLEDYKNAYFALGTFSALKDELENEEKLKTTRIIEARFRDEKKQLEIESLREKEIAQQNEIRQKDETAKAERNLRYVFSIGFILVLGMLIVIFRALRSNQKKNKIITQQQKETEHQKSIIEEKNKEILDSIQYARNLQQAILPPLSLLEKKFNEIALLYLPKDIVAGDFYFSEALPNGKIVLAAADSTGHGVPGAMVSVVCSNALRQSIREHQCYRPAEILNKTRELVISTFVQSEREVKDGMDISLAVFDPETHQLFWSGANNGLWIFRAGEILELKPDKQPVGMHPFSQAFSEQEIQLEKGDLMVMFTDGFADQFGGPKGKKFKESQLKAFIAAHAGQPATEIQHRLLDEIDRWKGDLEQIDDITIILSRPY